MLTAAPTKLADSGKIKMPKADSMPCFSVDTTLVEGIWQHSVMVLRTVSNQSVSKKSC